MSLHYLSFRCPDGSRRGCLLFERLDEVISEVQRLCHAYADVELWLDGRPWSCCCIQALLNLGLAR